MPDKLFPLVVRGLSKTFPSKPPFRAVDDVSFEVSAGEILGLLGPNGAGKTTIIRMLISVLEPSAGIIEFFGRNLKEHRSEVLQHVAFASTYTHLPLFLTVEENLDVHGRLYGMSRAQRLERAEELLSLFGIAHMRKLRASQLSAGQRTRLMLVKAFLPGPRIALLDEPTAALDPEMAEEVRSFVSSQRGTKGTTILFTSHNMHEVSQLCDRVIFLKDGKIAAEDSPAKLASSVGDSRLELVIEDGLQRSIAILEERRMQFNAAGSELHAFLRESEIASLLLDFARAGVSFSHIRIRTPSLEDYFIKAAR